MSELPKKLVMNQRKTDIGFLDNMGLFVPIHTLELATEVIHRYDCHDDLLEQLTLIVGLLCHPRSFVNAQDIEKAKDIIAKAQPKQSVKPL